MAGKSLKHLQPLEKLRGPSKAVRYRYGIILLAICISALIHIVSVQELDYRPVQRKQVKVPQKPVKITLVEKTKEKPKKTSKDDELLKKLLETPQTKTEKPTLPSFAGVVDHKTDKQTRLKEAPQNPRAQDAGQSARTQKAKKAGVTNGDPMVTAEPKNLQKSPKNSKPKSPSPSSQAMAKATEMKTLSQGKVAVTKPRNSYEALLPQGDSATHEQLQAGYREYVDQSIAEGDKIDINTSEYRYIGYFSTMRKAIELVWNYPKDAARKGLQGEVGLEFAIEKDGSASQIKVLKSSGYELLDRAIVEAISLASPFSPLPDGFGKKKIVVTGSFRYVLYGYNMN